MIQCPCSGKHVPAPMKLVSLDRPSGGVVQLCPTSRTNLERLLSEYAAAGGVPLGSVTKHYGRLVRTLAKEIYFDRR